MIEKIDIQKLLTELNRDKGLSDDRIAKELTVSGETITGATICRLRTGVTRKTDGDRMVAIANFHEQVFQAEK